MSINRIRRACFPLRPAVTRASLFWRLDLWSVQALRLTAAALSATDRLWPLRAMFSSPDERQPPPPVPSSRTSQPVRGRLGLGPRPISKKKTRGGEKISLPRTRKFNQPTEFVQVVDPHFGGGLYGPGRRTSPQTKAYDETRSCSTKALLGGAPRRRARSLWRVADRDHSRDQ